MDTYMYTVYIHYTERMQPIFCFIFSEESSAVSYQLLTLSNYKYLSFDNIWIKLFKTLATSNF